MMNSVLSKVEMFDLCLPLPSSLRRIAMKSFNLSSKFFDSLKVRCEKAGIEYPGDDFLLVASVLMYMLPGKVKTEEELSQIYTAFKFSVHINEFMRIMKVMNEFILVDKSTSLKMFAEIERAKQEDPILFILCAIDYAARLKVYLNHRYDDVGCVLSDYMDHFLE